MKILLSFTLFTLLLSSLCFGEELHGEFNLIGTPPQITEGDLVEGVLKIWPVENPDLGEFNKLENFKFFNQFDLIQIQSIETSSNNADLVEVKGLFLVKISGEVEKSLINYKHQEIAFEAPAVKVIPLKSKTKDFFVLNQSYHESVITKFIFWGGLVCLLFLTLWKKEAIKKLIYKNRLNSNALLRQKYQTLFTAASTRKDFEEIYQKKNEWLTIANQVTPKHEEFLETINRYQYQKHWEAEELEKVRMSFDQIRGIFK
ncbi:MAG: hypothetical protein KBD76_12170 [Bacteriovorax sp.]|jgi:hypothetical protein|nr:hypothetical protein [Bacteriovorax sp.]